MIVAVEEEEEVWGENGYLCNCSYKVLTYVYP